MNPIFEQCLPNTDIEAYELLPPRGAKNKFQHQLYYKNLVTGVVYKVPNIWYNQPIQWGIDYYVGMATIKRNFAAEIRRTRKDVSLEDLKAYYDSADMYDALAYKLIENLNNGQIFRTI